MVPADPKEVSRLQFFDPEELLKQGLGPLAKDRNLYLRLPPKEEKPKAETSSDPH